MEEKAPETTFENELEKLQRAVASLESSDLSLEEAFRQLEVGCAAYKICRNKLESARARVETLVQEIPEGRLVWEPFSGGAAGE